MNRTPAPTGRIASLDITRGLVMVLMALDHCRDFLASGADLVSPLDPATTTPERFATRWVTHLCAPAFVFLAGVSVRLSLSRSGDVRKKSLKLALRGLVLIMLELTLVRLAWMFGWDIRLLAFLQVIWALGVSMLVMAGLLFTPDWSKLLFGLALVAGHNLLDRVTPGPPGPFADVWHLLHAPGSFSLGSLRVVALYPLVPWVGMMPLGFVAGRLWERPAVGGDPVAAGRSGLPAGGVADPGAKRRAGIAALSGAACLALFALLRGSDIYGDPRPWTRFPEMARTAYSFLDVTKYPPSLDYLLATMGLVLLVLALAERGWGRLGRVLAVFGRAPLFFYVVHLYLAHALAWGVGLVHYGWADWPAVMSFESRQAGGAGVGLGTVYLVWLATVAALYLPCGRYGEFRARHPGWWASLF